MIHIHLTPDNSINETLSKYALDSHLTIHLSPGIYHEKVFIYHQHVKLIGTSRDKTILTWSDYAYKMHEDGLLFNTFRTSTLTVLGDHVHLENLTIKNEAGSGFTIGQAVALSLYGNQSHVINCIIDGHQDTLFVGPLPADLVDRYEGFLMPEQCHTRPLVHFFDHCDILGDVDFIFGTGTAIFNHCDIIAKDRGYICAPSTDEHQAFGLVFIDSRIINQSNAPIYLARPWREHGATHFLNCQFEGIINHLRYDAWDKKFYRFYEKPYVSTPFSKLLNEEVEGQLGKVIMHTATSKK